MVKGTIINKFRGDVKILEPGLDMLEDIIHIPTLGVVPYLHLDVDDEDSLTERFSRRDTVAAIDIAVIRFPRISNFTDFNPLEYMDQVSVRYITSPGQVGDPDLIILPRHQKHHGRPVVDAPERAGSNGAKTRGGGETSVGNLRWVSDAGQDDPRPAWRGARRRNQRYGSFAAKDGICRRENPYPYPGSVGSGRWAFIRIVRPALRRL